MNLVLSPSSKTTAVADYVLLECSKEFYDSIKKEKSLQGYTEMRGIVYVDSEVDNSKNLIAVF